MTPNTKHTILYERYKPRKVADLVLPDNIKTQIQQFVDNKDVPNLGLMSSIPGTGKTSTANAIACEMGVETLWINASIERNIDLVREKLQKFASTNSFDDERKLVVMDEADGITKDAQKAFRGFLDDFSENCRFIFTGNYKENIIEPLLQRLQVYDFNDIDKKSMVKQYFERLKLILDTEGIKYDPKDLVPIINAYSSLRPMIGSLQQFIIGKELIVDASKIDSLDVFNDLMNYVKTKNYQEAVKLINDLSSPDNFYKFLYKEIDKFYKPDKQPRVIVTLAKYQHMSVSVRDVNLNLSACVAELISIG